MSIKKSRRSSSYSLNIDGREYLHLDVVLPGGEQLQISMQFGSIDVNDHAYVSINALFDPKSKVEFSKDMPQQCSLVIRSPRKSS